MRDPDIQARVAEKLRRVRQAEHEENARLRGERGALERRLREIDELMPRAREDEFPALYEERNEIEETLDLYEYTRDRTARGYYFDLGGLDRFFSEVRALSAQRNERCALCDMGAGSTRAAQELAATFEGSVDVTATTLTHHPDTDKYLGRDKTRLTSLERLSKIPVDSLHGALLVQSFGYAEPAYAANALFEKMKAGGMVKCSFLDENELQRRRGLRSRRGDFARQYATVSEAAEAFRRAGFVVATEKNIWPSHDQNLFNRDVLLARKPTPGADLDYERSHLESLLAGDLSEMRSQADTLPQQR